MFTISKEFHFCASHQLEFLAQSQPDHPCARDHGHNYVVIVEISGQELNENWFILDYRNLDWFKKCIDEKYDHRRLNNVVLGTDGEYKTDGRLTTAEMLAMHFFYQIFYAYKQFDLGKWQLRVGVKETDKTCAWYTL